MKWHTAASWLLIALAICGCEKPAKTNLQIPTPNPPPEIDWGQVGYRRLAGDTFAISPTGFTIALLEPSKNGVTEYQFATKEDDSFSSRTFLLGDSGFTHVAYSPNGQWLAALEVGMSGPARIYVISPEGDPIGRFKNGIYSVCHISDDSHALQFSVDSKYVRSTMYLSDYITEVFEVASGARVYRGPLSPSWADDRFRSPDGKSEAIRSADRLSLAVKTGSKKVDLEIPGEIIRDTFHFLTNNIVAALIGKDADYLAFWDLRTTRIEAKLYLSYDGGWLIEVRDGSYVYVEEQSQEQPMAPGRAAPANPKKVTEALARLIR